MASTKASGVNIPEAQRTTEAIKLRLDPEAAEDLRELADEMGISMSAVVNAAMLALYRAKNDLAGAKGMTVYTAFVNHCEGNDDQMTEGNAS